MSRYRCLRILNEPVPGFYDALIRLMTKLAYCCSKKYKSLLLIMYMQALLLVLVHYLCMMVAQRLINRRIVVYMCVCIQVWMLVSNFQIKLSRCVMILHCVLLAVAVALTAYFSRVVCHHHRLIVFLLIPMMRNVCVCVQSGCFKFPN
jgi:hypothetical protein